MELVKLNEVPLYRTSCTLHDHVYPCATSIAHIHTWRALGDLFEVKVTCQAQALCDNLQANVCMCVELDLQIDLCVEVFVYVFCV